MFLYLWVLFWFVSVVFNLWSSDNLYFKNFSFSYYSFSLCYSSVSFVVYIYFVIIIIFRDRFRSFALRSRYLSVHNRFTAIDVEKDIIILLVFLIHCFQLRLLRSYQSFYIFRIPHAYTLAEPRHKSVKCALASHEVQLYLQHLPFRKFSSQLIIPTAVPVNIEERGGGTSASLWRLINPWITWLSPKPSTVVSTDKITWPNSSVPHSCLWTFVWQFLRQDKDAVVDKTILYLLCLCQTLLFLLDYNDTWP